MWFAEGQVWKKPARFAWLGILNPQPSPQAVTVTVFRSGGTETTTVTVPARTRSAFSLSQLFPTLVNEAFGTEVVFTTIGMASLVMWDEHYTNANVAQGLLACQEK